MSASTTLGTALVAAGLAAAMLTTGAAAPQPGGFALGVLRRDGLVVPFATFDGRGWGSDWPEPQRHVDEVPITLGSVPRLWWGRPGLRDTWQASVGPGERVELRVNGTRVYGAQCLQQIALRTDYRSREPLPRRGVQPYPKDGLAVSPPYPIEHIDEMPIPLTTPPLVEAFNAAEVLSASKAPPGTLGEIFRLQKGKAPLTIEAAYAAGDLSSRTYYFEVVRRYEWRPGECQKLSYGAGWFARDANGSLRKLSFEATITSCDRNGLLYMLPLGVVRVAGRSFWIAQWSGWNLERYGVVEIKPNGTEDMVSAFGGGC